MTVTGVSRGDSLNTVQGTELSLEEKEEEALEEAREWKAVRTEETARRRAGYVQGLSERRQKGPVQLWEFITLWVCAGRGGANQDSGIQSITL